MGAALAEFKVDALSDTLLPDGEDPGVIQGPCARIGLTAHHHQLHTTQVSLQIYRPDERLADDILVFNWEPGEQGKAGVRAHLVLHGAAHRHVVIALAPVGRNAR